MYQGYLLLCSAKLQILFDIPINRYYFLHKRAKKIPLLGILGAKQRYFAGKGVALSPLMGMRRPMLGGVNSG